MSGIGELYQQLVNAIIRPPRFDYTLEDLGSPDFRLGSRQYFRKDFELTNARQLTVQCSLYAPTKRPKKLPCVIYCHGNSGCRLDAQDAVRILLPMNIMVFAFDFAGCGLSTGDFVSLGFFERDDLRAIMDYLRKHENVTRIALWGRSMGAVTSIMYGSEDPSVACLVVDSPFSSLRTLAHELVERMAAKLPSLVVKAGYKMVRSSVKKQAKFDIDDLETIKSAQASYVPALFGHGEDDSFIAPSHSNTLHNAYAGDKNLILFGGDHNSRRPQFFLDSVSIFIRNYLLAKSDFGSDNPLPAGESFDSYFSPSFGDDFDELDNFGALNLLAETFYARQKDDSVVFAPTNADEEDEQLRQAILLSLQASELSEDDRQKSPRGPSPRKDRQTRSQTPEVKVSLEPEDVDPELAAAIAEIDAKHADVAEKSPLEESGSHKRDKKDKKSDKEKPKSRDKKKKRLSTQEGLLAVSGSNGSSSDSKTSPRSSLLEASDSISTEEQSPRKTKKSHKKESSQDESLSEAANEKPSSRKSNHRGTANELAD